MIEIIDARPNLSGTDGQKALRVERHPSGDAGQNPCPLRPYVMRNVARHPGTLAAWVIRSDRTQTITRE
jgi:hypothetical protein